MPCGHKQRVEDAENRFWKRAEDGLGIDRMKKVVRYAQCVKIRCMQVHDKVQAEKSA
jgi:hypothetical protein